MNGSLTSFPAIDLSSAEDISYAWANCYNLANFPTLDYSNIKDMSYAWLSNYLLTSFPNTGNFDNVENCS